MSPTSISWDYWAPPRKVTSPEAVPHRLVSKYSPTVTAQDSRLSQNWLRAVLWENGARLFGVGGGAAGGPG